MFFKFLISFALLATVLSSDVTLDKQQTCSNETGLKSSSIFIVGLASACIFCFVGVLPSFFIRTDADEERFVSSTFFKLLLAFAAGSLLGDVFLHLLPEISSNSSERQSINNGMLIIGSFFIFLIIEVFTEKIPNTHALGTLNLVANFFDNMAHGTTVIGAFQNSKKFGIVALIATIIHEIPHEFSDFALLLRDKIPRGRAVFFQIVTAFAGTIGATLVYAYSSQSKSEACLISSNLYTEQSQFQTQELNHHHHMGDGYNSFILPFTIGGFLYIALVGILPEILKEECLKISILQLVSFVSGVLFIFLLLSLKTF